MQHAARESPVNTDFDRDGVLFPIRVLDDDELRTARAALEAVGARLGGAVKRMDWAHLFFDWAFDITTHPRLVEPLAAILGPDVIVQSSRLLCKYPHDESYVGWHQDGLYSGVNQFPSVTAWVALTDASIDNGCLRVIPGSHRHGVVPHVETYARDNLTNHGEEVSVPFDRNRAVDVLLKAGDASLHHVNVIHGSAANRSATTRVGYSISYVTPAVGQLKWPVVSACGRCDLAGVGLLASRPHGATDAALAQHAEFLRRGGHKPVRLR